MQLLRQKLLLVLAAVSVVAITVFTALMFTARTDVPEGESAEVLRESEFPARIEMISNNPLYLIELTDYDAYLETIIPLGVYGRTYDLTPQGTTGDEPVHAVIIRVSGPQAITANLRDEGRVSSGLMVHPGGLEVYIKIDASTPLSDERLSRTAEELIIETLYKATNPEATPEEVQSVLAREWEPFLEISKNVTDGS